MDFYFSTARIQLNRNCDLPLLFRKTSNAHTANASNLLIERDEGQKIQKYVELLMPLLFETWMEVRPSKLNNANATDGFDDEDFCITNEAAFTLKTTVEIVEQLLELIQMCDRDVNHDDLIKWFRRKYGQEFLNQFLTGFPYQQIDGFKGTIFHRQKNLSKTFIPMGILSSFFRGKIISILLLICVRVCV